MFKLVYTHKYLYIIIYLHAVTVMKVQKALEKATTIALLQFCYVTVNITAAISLPSIYAVAEALLVAMHSSTFTSVSTEI